MMGRGKAITVPAEDQRALCRYRIWWLRREEKQLREQLDKQSNIKQKAKDDVLSLCLQLDAEKLSVAKNMERLSALEIKIRKDLDHAAVCVRWLRQAKLPDSQSQEMRRRDLVARRLDRVLMARSELNHKLDEVETLKKQLIDLSEDATTRIQKKLLRGRDYVTARVVSLEKIRGSEQNLRRRIAITVKRRETLKDIDRMLRLSQVGSLDVENTREALLGLKQTIRESGILQASTNPMSTENQDRDRVQNLDEPSKVIPGSKLISWLVKNQISANRAQGARLGSILLDWGILFDIRDLASVKLSDDKTSLYKFRSDAPKLPIEGIRGWLLQVGRWRSSRMFFRWNSAKMLLRSYSSSDSKVDSPKQIFKVSHRTICRAVRFSGGAESKAFCFELTDPSGRCLTLGAPTVKDRGLWLQTLWASGCTMHKNVLRQPKPKRREILRMSTLGVLCQPANPSSPRVNTLGEGEKKGSKASKKTGKQKIRSHKFTTYSNHSLIDGLHVAKNMKVASNNIGKICQSSNALPGNANGGTGSIREASNADQKVGSGLALAISHANIKESVQSTSEMCHEVKKKFEMHLCELTQAGGPSERIPKPMNRKDSKLQSKKLAPLMLTMRKQKSLAVREVMVTGSKIESPDPISLTWKLVPKSGAPVVLRASNFEEYEDWINSLRICAAPPEVLSNLKALEEAFGDPPEDAKGYKKNSDDKDSENDSYGSANNKDPKSKSLGDNKSKDFNEHLSVKPEAHTSDRFRLHRTCTRVELKWWLVRENKRHKVHTEHKKNKREKHRNQIKEKGHQLPDKMNRESLEDENEVGMSGDTSIEGKSSIFAGCYQDYGNDFDGNDYSNGVRIRAARGDSARQEWGAGDIELLVPRLARELNTPLGRFVHLFKRLFAELYFPPDGSTLKSPALHSTNTPCSISSGSRPIPNKQDKRFCRSSSFTGILPPNLQQQQSPDTKIAANINQPGLNVSPHWNSSGCDWRAEKGVGGFRTSNLASRPTSPITRRDGTSRERLPASMSSSPMFPSSPVFPSSHLILSFKPHMNGYTPLQTPRHGNPDSNTQKNCIPKRRHRRRNSCPDVLHCSVIKPIRDSLRPKSSCPSPNITSTSHVNPFQREKRLSWCSPPTIALPITNLRPSYDEPLKVSASPPHSELGIPLSPPLLDRKNHYPEDPVIVPADSRGDTPLWDAPGSSINTPIGKLQRMRRRCSENITNEEISARMSLAARDVGDFVRMATSLAVPEIHALAHSQGARLKKSVSVKRTLQQALVTSLISRFAGQLRNQFVKIHNLEDGRLQTYLCSTSVQTDLTLKSLGVSEGLQLPLPQSSIFKKPSDRLQQNRAGFVTKDSGQHRRSKCLMERSMTPPPRAYRGNDINRFYIGNSYISIWSGGAYADAVLVFQGLNEAWTPVQVLKCLSMSARRLCECVDAHATRKSIIGADDVLLLFVFLIAKARVSNLHARIHLTETFMTPVQRSSKDGYYLATINAALELLNERINKDTEERIDDYIDDQERTKF